MREAATYDSYRAAATALHSRLFRNNVGVYFTRDGRRVRVGLQPGSADLIGWHPVTITPEMVGAQVAVFLSVEVKLPGGKTKPATAKRQKQWREAVNQAGGIGLCCYTVEEMQDALQSAHVGVE